METAINIAFACSLIDRSMTQFTVKASFSEVDELEDDGRYEDAARLGNSKVRDQLEDIERRMLSLPAGRQSAMIIEGKVGDVKE